MSWDFRKEPEVKSPSVESDRVAGGNWKTLKRWQDVLLYMYVYGYEQKTFKESGRTLLQTFERDGVKCGRWVDPVAARTLFTKGMIKTNVETEKLIVMHLTDLGKQTASEFLAAKGEEERAFALDAADAPDTGAEALRIPLTEKYHAAIPKAEEVNGAQGNPVPVRGTTRPGIRSGINGIKADVSAASDGVVTFTVTCPDVLTAKTVAMRLRLGDFAALPDPVDEKAEKAGKFRTCRYCKEDYAVKKVFKNSVAVCAKKECKKALAKEKNDVLLAVASKEA